MPKSKAKKTDPALPYRESIEIEGKRYKLRRLGATHIFPLSTVLAYGARLFDNRAEIGTAQLVQMLIAALHQSQDAVLECVAYKLGVTVEELSDSERFPLDSVMELFEVMAEAPEVRTFLDKLQTKTGMLFPTETA